jgi:hypothetical protein
MVCTLASGRISEKKLAISFPAKITSTYFTWKTRRCNFCGQNKKWRELFQCMKLEKSMAESIPNQWERVPNWGEHVLRLEKHNSDKNSVGKRSRIGIILRNLANF